MPLGEVMRSDEATSELMEFLKANELFENIPDDQLLTFTSIAKEMHFETGDVLIHEGEASDHIYIVKSGKVEVSKRLIETLHSHRLITLGPHAVIGEFNMIDQEPRSATVRALVPTTVYEFSSSLLKEKFNAKPRELSRVMDKLAELEEEIKRYDQTQPFLSVFIQNVAKHLSKRLRTTNDAMVEAMHRELEHVQARVAMGALIITVIVVLSLYLFCFSFVETQLKHLATSSIISIPMILIFSLIVFFGMKKTGYPMRTFGLTLKNWPTSVLESLVVTVGMILILFVVKWIMIHIPGHSPSAFWSGEFFTPKLPVQTDLIVLIAYLAFVPLQEFIARGALQSSFQEFLVGPYRNIWALVLSNLLFGTTHLHLSLGFGIMVIIPGFVWGWLYFRERTLIGPIISHQIFGAVAFFLVGLN